MSLVSLHTVQSNSLLKGFLWLRDDHPHLGSRTFKPKHDAESKPSPSDAAEHGQRPEPYQEPKGAKSLMRDTQRAFVGEGWAFVMRDDRRAGWVPDKWLAS